ncbi:hypothetical protein GCM10007301_11250 [Azorhizobium oxalatiphilum]|uniref:Uncharacterized protein n=1 Tax=Azorhizobium oxalatiphilum TaxID=980631 RepID=A0A917BP63_9HYPH|nr:hypothetical protein GCM10007301_11250 [Azorhizobium oxalatiphilum]
MSGDDDKAARLAAALRANLARRKAQKRARAAEADSPAPDTAATEPDGRPQRDRVEGGTE